MMQRKSALKKNGTYLHSNIYCHKIDYGLISIDIPACDCQENNWLHSQCSKPTH